MRVKCGSDIFNLKTLRILDFGTLDCKTARLQTLGPSDSEVARRSEATNTSC